MTDRPDNRLPLGGWVSSTVLRLVMVLVAAAVAFQAVRGAVALNGERIDRLREVHDRDIATLREWLQDTQARVQRSSADADTVQESLADIRMDIRELKTILQARTSREDAP